MLVGIAAYAQAGPVIHLGRAEYELGDVWYGDTKSCKVGVTNKGDADLKIVEVHTSCGCTTAKVESRTLKPGQKTLLTISFDATGIAPGRKTQTAFIRSNDPERAESSVRVFATVKQQIQVEPMRIVARMKGLDKELSFPMRVTNVSDRPVTLSVATSRGSVTEAATKPDIVAVKAGESVSFTLQAHVGGAPGTKFYRGAVILKSTHPKEDTIVVPVFISVVAGLQ
jgi:hypothetical protein